MYLKKSVKTKVNKHSFEKIFWKNSKESKSKKKPRKSTYKIHLKRTHQKSKQRSLENKSQERILLTHKKILPTPRLATVWITLIFFFPYGSPISNFLGFMHSTFLLHIFPDLHSWKFALYYANTTLKNMSQKFWTI